MFWIDVLAHCTALVIVGVLALACYGGYAIWRDHT